MPKSQGGSIPSDTNAAKHDSFLAKINNLFARAIKQMERITFLWDSKHTNLIFDRYRLNTVALQDCQSKRKVSTDWMDCQII